MPNDPDTEYDPESDEQFTPIAPIDFHECNRVDWSIFEDMGIDDYE